MFKEPLAAAIVKGQKTATRRRLSENPRSPWHFLAGRYPVGKVFAVNPGRGVTRVAECEVTGRDIRLLGEVTTTDARREGFASVPEFREAWKSINGSDRSTERIHVIEFKLVGPICMGCDGCGWCEGSPAFDCPDCFATGIEVSSRARALIAKVGGEP